MFSDTFPSIMGKSIVESLLVFLIGYIVYSDKDILDKMIKSRTKYLYILIISAICWVVYLAVFKATLSNNISWILNSVFKNAILICTINTVVVFSSLCLNKANSLLSYLNKSAFAVYIIHQPILLVLAFFIVPVVKSTTMAMILIIIMSLTITFAVFEVIKRVKIFNIALKNI